MRPRTEEGFTIVELMLVITIIAVLISLAVPNLLSARMRANETAAVSMLRTIGSGQATYQTRAVTDPDADGTGSFGYFGELAGATVPRGASEVLTPPILSSTFRLIVSGRVKHSGYYFRIYLPDTDGVGLPELPTGGAAPEVDDDLSEVTWCCYAWPINAHSGDRVFVTNQRGDVVGAPGVDAGGSSYGGGNEPEPDAAFLAPSTDDSILGVLAVGTTGTDGRVWVAIQ